MPPPESHSDATAPAPGEHCWYYRGPQGVSGPVSTKRMLQDAHCELLTSQSEVRLGLEGDWVRASTLVGLLPRSPTDGGPPQQPDGGQQTSVPEPSLDRSELTRAVTECRLYIHEREAARANQSAERLSQPLRSTEPFMERYVSGVWNGTVFVTCSALGVLETILEVIAASLPSLSTARRVIGSRLVWGVTVSCLIVAVAIVVYNATTKQQRQVATVEQIASELRSLRDRSADDTTWAVFTERTRESLRRMTLELEESADANDRVSIDLLWAARDFLPHMLMDARSEPSEAERQFDVCMRRIHNTYESAQRRSWIGLVGE